MNRIREEPQKWEGRERTIQRKGKKRGRCY